MLTNGKPALREQDNGMHAACCGTNTWKAVQGSGTVFINNKPAVRLGDQTKHCGGSGRMIEGSHNVMIGGATSGGGSGGGGGSSPQGGGGAQGSAASQSGSNSNQTGSVGGRAGAVSASAASSADQAAAPAKEQAPLEPQPLLVSAKWSKDRVPVSTSVTLSATCTEMSGKSATFTICDADDDTKTITTVSGACGDSKVEATWTTPADGPPGRFAFTVTADGKEAASGILTMINAVEVKLFLDDEPAEGVSVRLRADPSGEFVTGKADDKGIVRFEEAPFGDYTLFLEDEGS